MFGTNVIGFSDKPGSEHKLRGLYATASGKPQLLSYPTACNYSYMQLMDFNARFYSPTLGRFIQPDSIVPDMTNNQAWNRYSYSYNNPLNYTDPSGHVPEGACGFGGGDCGTQNSIEEELENEQGESQGVSETPCTNCHFQETQNKHSYKNVETFFPGGYFPELPSDLSSYSYETENFAPLVPGAQPIYPYIPNKVKGAYYVGSVADLAKDVLQYLVAYKWAISEHPLNVLIVFEFSLNENTMPRNLPSNSSVTVHNVAVANMSNTKFQIIVGQRDGNDMFSGFVGAGEIKQFSVNLDINLTSEILIGMNNADNRAWWIDSTYLP